MTDKDDSEDDALWAEITKGVEPMPGRTAPPQKENPAKSLVKRKKQAPDPSPAMFAPQSKSVDKRTEERFRRGQMPIEARLDLHGMDRYRAYEALQRFILEAHQRGRRCVLVITGRGKEKARVDDHDWGGLDPGILRRSVPDWLVEAPLRDIVLKFSGAKPKDGGAGAFYVLLRRKRD